MNLVVRDVPVKREMFGSAMSHLTGGVSVIKAGRGDDISGMTVTSVVSVAIQLPTLTVAINLKSSTPPSLWRPLFRGLWSAYVKPEIGRNLCPPSKVR
jgi:hypothetical protein